MSSMFRSSVLAAVVLFALAPAAIAGPCPTPPYSVCEPFSTSGVWYSDATKTTVVGGWWHSCPNVNTCLGTTGRWGERTAYSEVDCEPCTPCGNCLAKNSGDEAHEHDSTCTLKAEAQDVAPEQAAENDVTEECEAL
jgi:hypothetical protein